MDENKLVEKTKVVMKKQQELTEVIDELKSEVKEVFYTNKKLNQENALLLAKIAEYEKHGIEAAPDKEESVKPIIEVKEEVKIEKLNLGSKKLCIMRDEFAICKSQILHNTDRTTENTNTKSDVDP